MIFCFSGTGNSLHAAQKIAEATSDSITMMTEKELNPGKTYSLKDGENLGFVFPIYWWGIPKQVEDFVRKLKLEYKKTPYAFGICTFGLMAHNGLSNLQKILKQKGIRLNLTGEIKMVDNYIVGYELADKKKQQDILTAAEEKLSILLSKIQKKTCEKTSDYISVIKPLVHGMYKTVNHRKHFRVTDACVGCGKCALECPSAAIELINKKPVWKKDCSFCLKCIHSCPAEAVQYGKTEGRIRYLFHTSGI